MEISIVIPTYEMLGRGVEMLSFSFKKIKEQSYRDFEVIISDHSLNNDILNLCTKENDIDIKYFRNKNKRGSPSANVNNGIVNSSGKIIKILCQDDYLYDKLSLQKTVESFDYSAGWLVTANLHTRDRKSFFYLHIPKYTNGIETFNTIGTHSCLTMLNNNSILFDENLIWFMDCEYFYRLHEKYGLPKVIREPTVVVTLWEGQVTNTLVTEEVVKRERNYILNKINNKERQICLKNF